MFAFVALAALPLLATTLSVSLDHDTLLLGDTATLTLKFEGSQPQGTPQLPPIPGLQITYIGQFSLSNTINGQLTSLGIIHNFQVKPAQAGDFTIPALTLKFGNEPLNSQPVKFKVTRAAPATPGSEAEQQSLALLRLVLPKKEMFAGETIVIEQQLLVRGDVRNIANLDLPQLQLDGCTTARPVQGQQRQVTIGSTAFALVPFYVPVTAMKNGSIKVGPVDGTVIVTLPSRGRDPFEGFGFFNSGVQQRIALSAPEQTLTVLPLPVEGRPASFTGAVGSYTNAGFSAKPANVAVGDPITIRVQIGGHGSLDAFTLPDQPAWKEFKAYPPTVKTETTGDLGLEGTKSFEQIVVPQNTEIKELPPFDFAYFNPETRRYETLHQPALPIIVRPGGSTPTPTIAANSTTAENQKPAQDIVHIKPRLGTIRRSATTWVKQPWFLALQGLPALVLIGAVVWRKRTDTLANNPRWQRQKQVAQTVNDGLAQLQPLAATGNSNEFFATVFRLMQEQIGERLNLPASAITEAVVDEKLRARGLGEGGADVLHELFQQCNQARYAPEESAQKLEAVIPKLKMALAELQEVEG